MGNVWSFFFDFRVAGEIFCPRGFAIDHFGIGRVTSGVHFLLVDILASCSPCGVAEVGVWESRASALCLIDHSLDGGVFDGEDFVDP